jgi:multicomponent K+:H+ antiporter subunit D
VSASHLLVAPIVLPLAAGALLVVLRDAPARVQAAIGAGATVALAAVAVALAARASGGEVDVYLLGNWMPPFGIALALDRLSGLMLVLVAVLALASLGHALAHWHARGEHFHALFQFQLMGLNGAFLTADLFNLFVFFEVLLIASYGLLLHAPDARRTRAATHYVAVNLTGSALFLVAVGLLYGLTGTLNLADLALRVAQLPAEDASLARVAGGLLLAVFCIKAAALPLNFWLAGTYSAAVAPVAALFAIMTKVGVYAVMRVFTLVFGPQAGVAALVAEPWLAVIGLATLAAGSLGALAAPTFATLASFLVVASAGTLLAAFALGTAEGLAAALFYLGHSTVAAAALFLLTEAAASRRAGTAAALFVVVAVAVAGLPPLSGFVAKLQILDAVAAGPGRGPFWTVLLAGSFVTMVALSRMGSRLFWKGEAAGLAAAAPVTLRPVAALVALLGALTVGAAPAQRYAAAAAAQLKEPGPYIERLLGAKPVLREGATP